MQSGATFTWTVPSSSARWGPVLKRYADRVVQRLFYGERTGETDFLNTLVVAKVEVPYGGISDRQRLPKFSESPAQTPPPLPPLAHALPGGKGPIALCVWRLGGGRRLR